jgi:hypothetical protein
LGLLAFSELWSAAATALDRFTPSWERTLGWFLLLLPFELFIAAVLLFRRSSSWFGLSLLLLNILLYAGFMVIDMFAQTAAPVGRGDWISLGVWAIFLAIVLLAAYLMAAGRKAPQEESN